MNPDSFLENRYEFKYILPPGLAYRLQDYIEHVGLVRDERAAEGPYTVNSLYFETPFLDDYYDKDASLLRRKKMRARIYDEDWGNISAVWLEIKGKRNFHIFKERTEVAVDDWDEFIHENDPLLFLHHGKKNDVPFLRRFSYLFLKGRYRPYIVVKYKRMAYLGQFSSRVRVTFDSDMYTCFAGDNFDNEFMTPVYLGGTVMEVKFNDRLPWWFTKATELFDIRRLDFSKYTKSLVTLRNSYRIPVSR